jgi:hypothetical protein
MSLSSHSLRFLTSARLLGRPDGLDQGRIVNRRSCARRHGPSLQHVVRRGLEKRSTIAVGRAVTRLYVRGDRPAPELGFCEA